MKIILAPNSLKSSLTSLEAVDAMAKGIARVSDKIDMVQLPVADGGDGTLAVFNNALSLERCYAKVIGPSGNTLTAEYLFDPVQKLAVIEMAKASGLALLNRQNYEPMQASSFGLGEVLMAAMDKGAEQITLGVGGSATTDAGIGMLIALGAQFLAANGKPLPGNGLSLGQIADISLYGIDPRLSRLSIQVLCDVTNPLLGNNGTARVFAPQKGATKKEVEQLESGMENFVDVVKRKLGKDMSRIVGGGAAGGISASLMTFLEADLLPGSDTILDMLKFDEIIADADLVLTAEGQLDEQTATGKAPFNVAARSKAHGVPCIAIVGCINEDSADLLSAGFTAIFSLCSGPIDLLTAMENASGLLCNSTEQVVRCFTARNKY